MLDALEEALAGEGLLSRGGLALDGSEGLPALPDGRPAQGLLLVGNAGSALWRSFKDSQEALDGAPDPLDRWTRRKVGGTAARFGLGAVFPFEGPPYFPFQRWAARAEPVFNSPLWLLIHPDYGLWHAYRAALLLPDLPEMSADSSVAESRANPCDACEGRPCLSACPVGAFSPSGYDVEACAGHLATPEGEACLVGGCKARGACPVGSDYMYQPDHLAFHMAAFARSRVPGRRAP